MAKNQTLTIGLAALLIGGAGGFLAGRAGGDADEAQASSDVTREAKMRRDSSDSAMDSGGSRRARNLEEALREPGQMARMQMLVDLYASMTPEELQQAADGLEDLPMGDRILASILLFSRWAEEDPQGALAYSNTMGFGGMFARPTILRSWASVDPVNAAKYYTEHPDEFRMMGGGRGPGGGDTGAELIAREWAKMDPDAALAWANTLDGRDKSTAMVAVVGELAISDPTKAASMAGQLEGDDQVRAYGQIARQWAGKDFDAAESWINTLSGEARDRAMADALDVLARTDPDGAASRIASISDAGMRDRAISSVAGEKSQSDPAGAAAWLLTQDTGNYQDPMRRIMGNWVGQDSAGALSFIESQPIGEVRDTATQTYLWMNRDGNPAQAVALAESISDERDRSRTIGMSAWRWMQQDEAAARAYVEQSSALSDNAKQRILSGQPPRWGRGRGR